MGRQKKDEVAILEQQIRELKSVNRSLLRRLKKVDRNFKEELENEKREVEKETENESEGKLFDGSRTTSKCRNCERGELHQVNICGRKFSRCETCGWRSKTEKTKS